MTSAVLVCAGCVAPRTDPEGLRAKTERQLRGVWKSREFAASDWEFAPYTNLTVYIYRVGRFRTNTNASILAEVLGAFVYKDRDGKEARRYPMELATGNRIRVGEFMEAIWPHYSFKSGALILEIGDESSRNYYRARLDKVNLDPGNPEALLPSWLIESQENDR